MSREVLPDSITPIKYHLNLTPNLNQFTFTGSLTFNFQVLHRTDQIVLNSKELKINQTNSDDFKVTKIDYDEKTDRVIFSLNKFLEPGEFRLVLEYSGILNDQMAGFYRSKYKNKYLAVTQFEAIDARRAFPCMDEPAHKAYFQVQLNIPENLTALSNTPVLETKLIITSNNSREYLKSVKFAETPKMSTYLLAFFVGEAEYLETYVSLKTRKVRVRVYCMPGSLDDCKFALELGSKTLKYFSEFFNIDYPLDKLDMIGIPDFSAGAMENWGLITFRSKYMLYNPDKTSEKLKRVIAEVVCHELAHQWFGNLVTMSWWSELWLNEGFATYMSWLAVDQFYPEWKPWERFYTDSHLRGLELDTLSNSHPIEVELDKASRVDEIFDAISYSKGSCVLAMLVSYLGLDDFRDGLRLYLKTFMYSNATTSDLWNSLGVQSGKPVLKLMNGWTKQTGYPLIRVSGSIISQERFNAKDNKANIQWIVPLNVPGESLVLDTREKEFKDFLKINCFHTGFYRTHYGKYHLARLSGLILNKKMGTIDRAGIISDLFNLAKYDYTNLSIPLDYLKYYCQEREYTVLKVIMTEMRELMSIFYKDHRVLESLKKRVKDLISPIEINWNEPELRDGLLVNMLDLVGECEIKNVSSEIRAIYYRNLAVSGEFKKLIDVYENTELDEEKNDILVALGYVKEIERSLDYSLEHVRSQDLMTVLVSGCQCFENRDFTMRYMIENWDKIYNKLGNGSFLLGRILNQTISTLSDLQDLESVEMFLGEHREEFEKFTGKINQAKETVRNRDRLRTSFVSVSVNKNLIRI